MADEKIGVFFGGDKVQVNFQGGKNIGRRCPGFSLNGKNDKTCLWPWKTAFSIPIIRFRADYLIISNLYISVSRIVQS
jgi:hypothetical protein